MAQKSKGNDPSNRKPSPAGHHKASDAHNAEMDRLKRDPNRIQKLLDREGK